MSTLEDMVREARAQVRAVTPAQLEAYLYSRSATVVDVREVEELRDHGRIAGAFHAPRGLLELWADPASATHRAQLDPARLTITVCGGGSRGALAAETLGRLGYAQVAYLDGGVRAWKQHGYPVVVDAG